MINSISQIERAVNGVQIPDHDFINVQNNGDGNPTLIQFKIGGSGGQAVLTYDLTYSGTAVTSVAITK